MPKQPKPVTMQDIFDHFGNQTLLARRLGLTPQAVSFWGDSLPKLRAYEILELAQGKWTLAQLPIKKAAPAVAA
jgi:hypothetical protein